MPARDPKLLQASLNYTFRDSTLLILALTHPSVAHENSGSVQHNQRLEFLGDAVLQLVLTEELYRKYSPFGEGPLTKARAQLVNKKTLAAQAALMELGAFLILSHGEDSSGGRARASALADAYEALIGAIFLDSDFHTARTFIQAQFSKLFQEVKVIPTLENPKGELQELLQAEAPEPPEYRLEAMSGPDHDRRFLSSVHYQGRELGRGEGKTKKEAESAAAASALSGLRPPA